MRGVVAVAIVCGALIAGSILTNRRPAHALPAAWYEGAGGYEAASRAARETGAPLLVYFHTDWCGYCKRMEAQLWPAPAVDKQLRAMVKVRLNPERSGEEQQLAARYGVHGYPSLFVERGGAPVKVAPFTLMGGAWNMATPDEFVAALRAL
jgi:thiol:disulfide interchange protein